MKSLNSLVVILALLLITPSLKAQREADSLQFQALRDTIVQLRFDKKHNEAIALGETLLDEATQKEFYFFMIEAKMQMARSLNGLVRPDDARVLLRDALAIANEHKMFQSQSAISNNIGISFFRQSRYDSTEYYFQLAVDLSRENLPDRLAVNLSNLAWIYGVMDDRERELEAYLAALKALNDNPDSYNETGVKSMTLGGIGDYYHFAQQFEKAKQFYEEKLALGKESGVARIVHGAHMGLGHLYRNDDYYDFEKSKENYEVIVFDEVIQMDHVKQQAKQSLAKLYRKEGDLDQAMTYFKQVYEFYKANKVDDFQASAAVFIGEIYIEQNRLDDAYTWLNIALNKVRPNRLISREKEVLYHLYKVDSLKGRYLASLGHFQRMEQIEDSLSSERSKDRIKELEIQFETEQTEKENLTLKSDLELKEAQMARQQAIQVFVVVVALTFIILAFLVYRGYQRKKKANEIISRQSDELKTLSRFKEGLTSMVVHDMRNPLNAILGFSQGTPSDDKLRNINRSGHQVLNLVNNMLDIQRFEEAKVDLNPEIFSAKELVATTINEVALLTASKSIRVLNNVPASLLYNADPLLFNRVLVNLLINSVKYSKGGTEVVVEAGKGGSGFQELVVRDRGHGISAEQLPHIFDKFWHNDPEKSGVLPSTGLGLSFCKMAVEAHGGSIHVDSVLHRGTSIFFSLPLADGVVPVENAEMEHEVHKNALSGVDLEIYRKYLPEFEKLEVFEVSEINKLLKSLEEQVNDKNLGRQLRTAAFQGDQSLYDQLLNQLREENLA